MQSTPYKVDTSAAMLGETVWFDLKVNTRVMFDDLADALDRAGLDKTMARRLAPSYAFRRALRAMARAKLVDRVVETAEVVTFQISEKVVVADGVDYDRLAVVTLDKTVKSGDPIACSDPVVKAAVDAEFALKVKERRTSDVTRLIRRILDRHRNKGVYPMKGGCYFADASHRGLIDNLEKFVKDIGGSVTRWDIAEGSVKNNVQVQTVVVDSVESAIGDLENFILNLKPGAGEKQLENTRERLEQVALDLAWNARRVGEHKARLEDYLAYCQHLLERHRNPVATAPAYKEEDCDGEESFDADDLPEGALLLPPASEVA